jgi:hypothetical protein
MCHFSVFSRNPPKTPDFATPPKMAIFVKNAKNADFAGVRNSARRGHKYVVKPAELSIV